MNSTDSTDHTAVVVCEAAIRAWVEPAASQQKQWNKRFDVGGKKAPIGERCLVFDDETTTGYSQGLLFGFFQVRASGELDLEGVFVDDDLKPAQLSVVQKFASDHGLTVLTRREFVETVFYPEVYELGALCIGYNWVFDGARIAIRAASGRGKHRRAFSFQLSKNPFRPRVRVEAISPRAAFIGFAPCKRRYRAFFKGRFLDLRTLVNALTGESMTLARACALFKATVHKTNLGEYGVVTDESLEYGRNDVNATWSLYEKVRDEYQRYTFATFENEWDRERRKLPRSAHDRTLLGGKRRKSMPARDGRSVTS